MCREAGGVGVWGLGCGAVWCCCVEYGMIALFSFMCVG